MNADLLSVYEDYYEFLLNDFNEEFGSSKEALRIAQGKILDPEFDRKEIEGFKKSMQNIIVSDEVI